MVGMYELSALFALNFLPCRTFENECFCTETKAESKMSTLRAIEGGMSTAAPRKLRTSQSVSPVSFAHCLLV